MDSYPIAQALEKAYPTPSLDLEWDKFQEVADLTTQLMDSVGPWWKAKVARNLLLPRSAEYFSRTRAERYGMQLDVYEEKLGTEERWVEAKPIAKKLGDLLRENDGPYYQGSEGRLRVESDVCIC